MYMYVCMYDVYMHMYMYMYTYMYKYIVIIIASWSNTHDLREVGGYSDNAYRHIYTGGYMYMHM